MKKWLLVFILATAFIACKSKKDAATAALDDASMPADERKIRLEIIQYPDSMELKQNLIKYFVDNGNYGTAIAETDNLIRKDSTNGQLWYIKAMLLSRNQDTAKAITAWEQVIRYDPRPENLIALGTLYAFTKNPLAVTMSDILSGTPNNMARSQALFIKGLYFSNIGDHVTAVAIFEECLKLDYNNLFAYREKAISLYELGQYLEALKVLELSINISKTNEENFYWAGRCFEKLNRKEEAIQNYEMALQLAPDYIEAKDALAKLGVKL
ncbi:MAG: hypothetical protein RLY16_1902 [Bacteroidota bacterium]|jgi:tetratricopeptide (TPR) repeat protein